MPSPLSLRLVNVFKEGSLGPSGQVLTNVGMTEAVTRVTPQRVDEVIQIAHEACLALGIARPRIAVAGLNPHAGEGGAMGDEDERIVRPAVAALAAAGIGAFGPLSADSMFHAAARARYDAALCMYHDQALIPAKTLNFAETVNVTLGGKPYKSMFKGGHWCKGARNRCRPTTESHDESTAYYAEGFRCCSNVLKR